jgi:hypothetical protein
MMVVMVVVVMVVVVVMMVMMVIMMMVVMVVVIIRSVGDRGDGCGGDADGYHGGGQELLDHRQNFLIPVEPHQRGVVDGDWKNRPEPKVNAPRRRPLAGAQRLWIPGQTFGLPGMTTRRSERRCAAALAQIVDTAAARRDQRVNAGFG